MSKIKIKAIRIHAMEALFADSFGGLDNVPLSMRYPAAHFQKIPRLGQYSTFVEIENTDGLIGWGEAFGLPHPGMSASLLRNLIGPALTGASLDRPQDASADLMPFFCALGHTRGAAFEALSAIDIALWDLLSKQNGVSLCHQLGAQPGPIAAYVGSVPFLAHPDETAARALAYKGEGYLGVKIKIGRGAAVDADHVAAARVAIGSGISLMLDANAAYDVATAIEVAKAVASSDVTWLEEPIRPDDAAGLTAVRAQSPVPIAAGENDFSFEQFERLARLGAVDFLQPNITRAGGVSGLLAIDRLCAQYGIKLAPHGVGSAIGLAAALHTCRAASSFTMYEANRLLNPLRDDLCTDAPKAVNGSFHLNDSLGHGVVPFPEMLQRHALPVTA